MLFTIIRGLVVGLIIGSLGRLLLPGKQDISLLMTIVIGVAAALLGGIVAWFFGVGRTPGIDWIQLSIQVVLAAAGVALFLRRDADEAA